MGAMAWLDVVVVLAAGLGTMRAAIDRGDLDEAARQGMLAGPAVVEAGLAAPDRPARLAAIAAAPRVTSANPGAIELLDALATAAAGPDRRVAIPAARAAVEIAHKFTRRDLPDDIAPDDVASWRGRWAALAADRDRWIELRVAALEVVVTLGGAQELAAALGDPDPAVRLAAIANVPAPVPASLRNALAATVRKDTSEAVALAAAATLCGDLVRDPPAPILDALGDAGRERIRALLAGPGPRHAKTDARRCIATR
jgi:hypothetical protein